MGFRKSKVTVAVEGVRSTEYRVRRGTQSWVLGTGNSVRVLRTPCWILLHTHCWMVLRTPCWILGTAYSVLRTPRRRHFRHHPSGRILSHNWVARYLLGAPRGACYPVRGAFRPDGP